MMFPGIIDKIIQFIDVLAVIGDQLPSPISVHGGVCLVREIDRPVELASHSGAMGVV